MCTEEDKEVKQAWDKHAEKVNKFLERAPFRYVKSWYFQYGDEYSKPLCTLCGSKNDYWCAIVTDRNMEFCYIGRCCWPLVESKVIYQK